MGARGRSRAEDHQTGRGQSGERTSNPLPQLPELLRTFRARAIFGRGSGLETREDKARNVRQPDNWLPREARRWGAPRRHLDVKPWTVYAGLLPGTPFPITHVIPRSLPTVIASA